MSKVTLYCPEPANLKLGPGGPGEQIEFQNGFAVFDSGDFPAWEEWVKHRSTPPIEILPPDSDIDPDGQIACPICNKPVRNQFALTGHLRSHAPKG
jgi:hypothetical protein